MLFRSEGCHPERGENDERAPREPPEASRPTEDEAEGNDSEGEADEGAATGRLVDEQHEEQGQSDERRDGETDGRERRAEERACGDGADETEREGQPTDQAQSLQRPFFLSLS